MAEESRFDDKTAEIAAEQPTAAVPAPPVAAQPAGKWHASRAVLIVLGVLAAIVVGGLGFAAGYAAGGHDGHGHHRGHPGEMSFHDNFRDNGMPRQEFRREMRAPFDQGPGQPQTSAPATPTP